MPDTPESLANLSRMRRMARRGYDPTPPSDGMSPEEREAAIENQIRYRLKLCRRIRYVRKRAFILAFAKIGVVAAAAKAAGVTRTAVYAWRANDPVFAEVFDEAMQCANDNLEAEAMRRAFKGSDRLLIFLLRGRKPEYQQRIAVENGGASRVVMLPADGPWSKQLPVLDGEVHDEDVPQEPTQE